MTSKKLIVGSMLAYMAAGFIMASNDNAMKYHFAPSRLVSRLTGRICNLPLPPHLRAYLYRGYSSLLGVNLDELPKDRDLNDYRCFNDFFTREIDLSKRPIDKKDNQQTLCSPCDGRVLSFGELKKPGNTVECVKGADYPLEEFLFGFSTSDDKAQAQVGMMSRICDSVL